MKKIIYLDNASTTPVRPEVFLAMKPYFIEKFGNPSAITKLGVEGKKVVEKSRQVIADCLSRRPNEIIFTSGGTESNNLAIFGLINYLEKQNKKISNLHFITTNIEHSSVTECFKEIERRGGQVDYLKITASGLIDLKELRKTLKPNTVLVSIGYANNEIGTVQPIYEIAKEVRHARKKNSISMGEYPYFHTDASQAGNWLNLNINELGVDLMTLDAQKMNGPKGIGILFIKAGISLSPIIFGGGQEKNLRSGTENVPLIVGQAKAFELARKNFEKRSQKVKKLRDYFWQKIQKQIPTAVLNGDLEKRLPNNLNFSISNINSEFLVLCLDEAGIVCSTKSACDRDEDESFVIKALGKSTELVKSSLRFSLSENISKKDIDQTVAILSKSFIL